MNKSWVKAGLLYLLATFLAACGGQQAIEAPSMECEDLLIDDSGFLAEWSRGQPIEDAHYGAIEGCGVDFYVVSGVAVETVYKYSDEAAAQDGYQLLLDIAFPTNQDDTFLESPPEIPASTTADDFQVFCFHQNTIPMCGAVARYDAYVVHFNTHMRPEFISVDDVENILQAIDGKMSQHLKHEG